MSDVEADPLAGLLCFDLYAASRAVTARYRPLLGDLDLTYPQFLVLVLLRDRQPRTIGRIGQDLRLDHGTLTPLLRRMEGAGLLTRSRSVRDERVVEVVLTEDGAGVAEHFAEIQCRITQAMGLTAEQARSLQADLRQLRTSVGAGAEARG